MLDLDKILAKHAAWLHGESEGQRADLHGMDLRGVDLCRANLCRADLRGADLREADLCRANLRGANLRGVDLRGASLYRANLYWANLREASLCWANLREANLSWANLRGADLRGADLCGADLCEADLCWANLCGYIPLHADVVRRYVLYVIPEARGGPRFIAGCRNFSVTEALSHWGPESPRSQPEYVAAIRRWLAENSHALTDVIEAVE